MQPLLWDRCGCGFPSRFTMAAEYGRMNSREQNWAEAMRAARRRDSAAYERLLSEIADVLRGLIRWRLGRLGLSAHVTEDLLQEVLIGLHTKRHTWDATGLSRLG